MNQLKPCPFCGHEAYIISWLDEASLSHDMVMHYQVTCIECDAETMSSESEEIAISAWNKRA